MKFSQNNIFKYPDVSHVDWQKYLAADLRGHFTVITFGGTLCVAIIIRDGISNPSSNLEWVLHFTLC